MSAVLGGDPEACSPARRARPGAGEPQRRRAGGGRRPAGRAGAAGGGPAGARPDHPLAVAGAFHTRFMAPAEEALRAHAATISPGEPNRPLLSNADGTVLDRRRRGAAHGWSPRSPGRCAGICCMATLRELGVTAVLELPPAGTLVGLVKRELRGTVDSWRSRSAATTWTPRSPLDRPSTPGARDDRAAAAGGPAGRRAGSSGSAATSRRSGSPTTTSLSGWTPTTSGSGTGSGSSSGASQSRRHRSRSTWPSTPGRKAVADAGLTPADIDTVIVASCTMPNGIPNAAAQTADRLGIHAAGAFDLNAACAGFCYALGTGADLVRAGSAQRRAGDRLREALRLARLGRPLDRDHLRRRGGRGGGRAGRSAEEAGDRAGRLGQRRRPGRHDRDRPRDATHLPARPGGVPVGDHARWRRSPGGPWSWPGWSSADIDVLVAHQANLRIVEAIARRLRARGAREDMVVADDIMYSGNTSSASIPLALDHMRAAGTVRRGDIAAVRRLRRGPVLRRPGRRLSLVIARQDPRQRNTA